MKFGISFDEWIVKNERWVFDLEEMGVDLEKRVYVFAWINEFKVVIVVVVVMLWNWNDIMSVKWIWMFEC
jgi:hypothetical protein